MPCNLIMKSVRCTFESTCDKFDTNQVLPVTQLVTILDDLPETIFLSAVIILGKKSVGF